MVALVLTTSLDQSFVADMGVLAGTLDEAGITLREQGDGFFRAGFVGDSFSFVWDWEFLFAYNPEISPQDRDKLIERDPLLFVTWLIYGYSRKGEGLTNPVMYAVRQTQRGLQEPAEFVQYRNMKGDHLHGLLASTAFSTDDRLLPQDDKTRTILRKRLFGPKS